MLFCFEFVLEKFLRFLEKQKFEPGLLVGSFMNVPKQHKKLAINFIQKYCIDRFRSKDKTIHNLLILFFSDLEETDKLFKFL